MTDLAASPARRSGFPPSLRQTLIVIGLGAGPWLLAALLLRALAPFGIYEGAGRVRLYLLIVPGTLPVVLLVRRIAGRAQVGLGMAVGTAAATLPDGPALAWAPGLHGTDAAQHAGAGAAILWGGGVGLALGALMTRAD